MTDDPDMPALPELLTHQFGVITRRQALRYGDTRSSLQHKLRRGGPWQKILPGVYVTHTGTVTPEQREMAALLHAGPGAVVTGAAAVRRHNLTCAGLGEIDVLVPSGNRTQSRGLVRVQHTYRMPDEKTVYSTLGLRFAPLPRAVADAARWMKRYEDVQAVVSQALQQGGNRCTIEELIDELKAGPKAGSKWFRDALAEASEGVRSVAEADLKRAIVRSRMETPMYNPRLYLIADDGTFTFLAQPDAWWQRACVAAEVDSLQYHFKANDYDKTLDRHNSMEAAGIQVLHFLPGNIKRNQDTIIATIAGTLQTAGQRVQPRIVAVPANVKDPEAYVRARLRQLQPA